MKHCPNCKINAEWNTADCPVCLGPLEEKATPMEEQLVHDLKLAGEVIEELERERDRLKKAMEKVRDTSLAMTDSLRLYPKGGTVILSEGPDRLHRLACESLYPENNLLSRSPR